MQAFVLGSAEWLQLRWPDAWSEIPIAAKELVPIVAGLAVWGSSRVGVHRAGVLRQHGRSTVSQHGLCEGPPPQSSDESTRVALG